MAGKKINELVQANAVADNDLFIVETTNGTCSVPYSLMKPDFSVGTNNKYEGKTVTIAAPQITDSAKSYYSINQVNFIILNGICYGSISIDRTSTELPSSLWLTLRPLLLPLPLFDRYFTIHIPMYNNTGSVQSKIPGAYNNCITLSFNSPDDDNFVYMHIGHGITNYFYSGSFSYPVNPDRLHLLDQFYNFE